jgi:CheY-like chemotaxis protein
MDMDENQDIPVPTPPPQDAPPAAETVEVPPAVGDGLSPTADPAPAPSRPARERPLVLVADDDNNFREVVTTKLQASGFDVVPAKSGDEALAKAKEAQPDLALLDINMPPGMAGTEVALQMEELPETRATKVLFLSGQDDPFPGVQGNKSDVSKELGVEDFIMKTESLDVLVGKVKAALGIA